MRIYDVLEKVRPDTEILIITNDKVYTFKNAKEIWVLFLFLEVKTYTETVHQLRIEVIV